MKKMKKIVTLALAMVMVLVMCIPALAETAKATITISPADGKGSANSTYAAYKLLDSTNSGENFAYTVNPKYADVLKTITGKTEDADIVKEISEKNDAQIRTFADTVYAQVKDMTPDSTTTSGKFENIDQGYYLIAETALDSNKATDTYSLVMLGTAGNENLTVTPKEDVPTLEKKVKETNDTTGVVTDWQDGADYDIGDAVPFKLTGTVSAKYADYKTYYYEFEDTMSAGLTFNADSVVVKADGVAVDASKYVVTSSIAENGETSFSVKFADLKQVSAVNANSQITVEYTATLNDNAVIGQPGNPNIAKLKYNNNPYADGDGSTNETPEDKVIVFTFDVVANKVDAANKALKGAGFTLYKKTASGEVQIGEELKGEDMTTFTFKGVDSGSYVLKETTVPAGYNKAADVEFTVKATYDTDSADPKLTALTVVDAKNKTMESFTVDSTLSTASTNVVNKTGTVLPATGGIGTTIFYVAGAIVMIGAVVLLVVRKKKAAK